MSVWVVTYSGCVRVEARTREEAAEAAKALASAYAFPDRPREVGVEVDPQGWMLKGREATVEVGP